MVTIDVKARDDDGTGTTKLGFVTSSQLARELKITPTQVRKYIKRLSEIAYPCFRARSPGQPLSQEQVKVIGRFRSLTLSGLRGDAVIEALYREDAQTEEKIREVCRSEGLSSEAIQRILEALGVGV